MEIAISLPDDLATQLAEHSEDLPRRAMEALAADAYRRGDFSSAEVQRILGLASRFEVATFLQEAGVSIAYSEAELEADRRTWNELRRA